MRPRLARAQACGPEAGETLSFELARIGAVSALTTARPVAFEYPVGHPCLLIKLDVRAEEGVGPEENIVAFSAVCPHRGARFEPSSYNAEHRVIGPCRWHGAYFDTCHLGMQVLGNANRELPRVLLEVDGDDIYAVGIVGAPLALTGTP